MNFEAKYQPCVGINFPVSIIGLGIVDLRVIPIEVIDEWFEDGKLIGVIEKKKDLVLPQK